MQLRSSPENISSQNLLSPQESSNLHVTEEIFTLVSINNLRDVETAGLIDFSLILGSIIHCYLSGSLAVSNLYARGAQTNLFIFFTIFQQSFVYFNEQVLLLLSFIEFILIFFNTFILPNRLSINLLAGSLIITIITISYVSFLASFGFTAFGLIINFYEIFNATLQLLIFSLLTMEQENGIEIRHLTIK